MGIHFRLACIAVAGCTLSAQTISNKSLSGKYYFRELLVNSATGQAQSLFGALTFDGNTTGGFTYAGQQLTGTNPAANASGSGSYSVQSSGLATMSDPLQSGRQIILRLGTTFLTGASTEGTGSGFSLLIAAPAPSGAVNTGALNGRYWMASLEFLNAAASQVRETLFPINANSGGSLGNPIALGRAANINDQQFQQPVSGSSYSLNTDGIGVAMFPIPSSVDPASRLIGGTKIIYVAADGSFFFGGGSTPGGQGLLIGIQAADNATESLLSGSYSGADLRVESQFYSGFAGSANALGDGRMVWSRRLVLSGAGAEDVTALTPYSVNPDGSGSLSGDMIAVGRNGQMFLGSGLGLAGGPHYELLAGSRAPSVSGSGLSLNPQGVFNVFSFAPFGNPVAPGEFITVYGTGLPSIPAAKPPFPLGVNGARLLINNTPAPLYTATSTQVFAVVPYSVQGSTATIVFDNNGTQSNAVVVPLAASAPGIAAVAQNGLGPGAITHSNGSLVTAKSPALRGETVVIYLTGLGAVSPAVPDGTGATGLSRSNSVLAVYFNGACGGGTQGCDASNILYQGLTPGYPGLYQINVTIPQNTPPSLAAPVAIQTASGFTDLVDIAIQ